MSNPNYQLDARRAEAVSTFAPNLLCAPGRKVSLEAGIGARTSNEDEYASSLVFLKSRWPLVR